MWPYSHNDASDKDWEWLNVTGPFGLFTVMVSTSWWAASLNRDSHHEAFRVAVEDLCWAIENLIHFNSRLQVTKSRPDTTPVDHFPGHGELDPGKRKIKPTPKVAGR